LLLEKDRRQLQSFTQALAQRQPDMSICCGEKAGMNQILEVEQIIASHRPAQ